MTGIQKNPFPALKVFEPQPKIAVKTLGEKSLAGLTAKPQLYPNDEPIMNKDNPIRIDTISCEIFELFLSVIARIAIMKREVEIN